jgi:hypothetical protein
MINADRPSAAGADASNPTDAGPNPLPNGFAWGRSILLFVVLVAIYSANRRTIEVGDTEAAKFIPIGLIRGRGPFLEWIYPKTDEPYPYYLTASRGHVLSSYPLGAGLVAMPFVLPQVLWLDLRKPGWDKDEPLLKWYATRMAKNAAAVIAALTAVALFQVLRLLEVGRMALPAALVAALGSDLWTVASQSLWQHGPAALMLTLALWLVLIPGRSRPRLVLAGLAAAAMVCCRSLDAVFAVAIISWMALDRRRDLAWFVPPVVVVGVALAGFNSYYFGSVNGGQARLEATHEALHAVSGTWTNPFLAGVAGTLLSPSRGLFVYSPWIAVALATIPAIAGRLKSQPLFLWLLAALAINLVALAKYSCWWAGSCFGPRFWTDAIPVFGILLGMGLDWSWTRCRPVFALFAATALASVVIQVVGAFYYPSSWQQSPDNVHLHHERLWDWRDNELTRCLREGPRAPNW